MLRPDLALAGMSPENRRALKLSIALHVGIVVLALLLPHLHRPPVIEPPRVVEAVLVSAAAVPRQAPAKPVIAPAPEPLPVVEPEPVKPDIKPVVKPLPVPVPKVALPQAKPAPEKPVPPKPATAKPAPAKPSLNRNALDAEMQALDREMQAQQMKADADRIQREAASAAASARDAANLALKEKHERLIRQRVITKWNRPLSARHGMVTTLRISVLPGGEVSNIVIIKSSGDAAFDASAKDAIESSSPLPVPDDIAVFNSYFRVFAFKFSPEDM
ncbi:MAG: TonB family protein [Moraxellaceae bacterium]|nr:TonB family protein [Moraxellaceae bacterium]